MQQATSPGSRRRPQCSARLVILRSGPRGSEVLLAFHRHRARAFWCFPGGGVEAGESVAQAARREAEEETGLAVALRGVCFLLDRSDVDRVEWFFLADAVGGEARLGCDPERPVEAGPVLEELRWVPLTELHQLAVFPRALADALADGRFFRWGVLPVPAEGNAMLPTLNPKDPGVAGGPWGRGEAGPEGNCNTPQR